MLYLINPYTDEWFPSTDPGAQFIPFFEEGDDTSFGTVRIREDLHSEPRLVVEVEALELGCEALPPGLLEEARALYPGLEFVPPTFGGALASQHIDTADGEALFRWQLDAKADQALMICAVSRDFVVLLVEGVAQETVAKLRIGFDTNEQAVEAFQAGVRLFLEAYDESWTFDEWINEVRFAPEVAQ